VRAGTCRQDGIGVVSRGRAVGRSESNGRRAWDALLLGILLCGALATGKEGIAWAGMVFGRFASATGAGASVAQPWAKSSVGAWACPAAQYPRLDYELLRPAQSRRPSSADRAAVASAHGAPQPQGRKLEAGASHLFRPALSKFPRIWRLAGDLGSGLIGAPTLRAAATGVTTRVSISSSGQEGNGDSFSPSVSADGRYVAFQSWATNFVSEAAYNGSDIFVHDRQTDATTLVSVSTQGDQANSWSNHPSISADGRYIAFDSFATNLVPGDTNGTGPDDWSGIDVFVHDCVTGVTTRVSVSSRGEQGRGESWHPSISAQGRYVAFDSAADNLVPGDRGFTDVFVHDCVTRETTRVSVASDGMAANSNSGYPSISADGRYVAFQSQADNLVPPGMATGGEQNIFLHDCATGRTILVSVSAEGEPANGWCEDPSLSADGRYVAFASKADNLVAGDTNGAKDVFVYDCLTGKTERVSVSSAGQQGNGDSWRPSISAGGRYVAFWSKADNLVRRDTNGCGDVFLHDRLTGVTTLESVSSSGLRGTVSLAYQGHVALNADGRYVVFDSQADNLVAWDANNVVDVFVRDRLCAPLPPGDMNQDGKVDSDDIPAVITAWQDKHGGRDWYQAADLNRDGQLTIEDVQLFIEAVLRKQR
jgi:Tol biopolymer transport system component